ncbi:MAG: nitroreductase family protein [Puniceicoccales bacterium]|jgi:nitroreductase|nr:nitroreductase family protein [Puniceicoccales bacterium]
MTFSQLTTARYSVRKFTAQPVEKAALDKILEAARNAPTAGNRQPQRILIIDSEEGLQKVDRCTPCRFGAPVVLLVGYDPAVCWKRHFDGANSGQVDVAIIGTHILLQATELNLGTTWVMHFDPEKTVTEFALSPQFIPVAMIVLGHPAPDSVPADRHFQRNAPEDWIRHFPSATPA